MRVARGMFRLWLVLSCLWIATVAAIGYSRWPSSTVQQAATSKDSKTYVPEWAKDQDPNDSKTYVPEFMKDASKDPKANDPKTYVPEYMKDQDPNNAFADFPRPGTGFEAALKDFEADAAQRSAQQLAVTTAELALIPPALIFIVGIGLTWAFRGFRHS